MAAVLSWLPLLLRRRKRERSLAQATSWTAVPARLLQSRVVPRDPLAEPASAFQDSQVESAFYFTLSGHSAGSYFGGHLRSIPMSDSEAHRALRLLPEETHVIVRYHPQDPDQVHTLAADNPGFPVVIWPF